MSARKARPFARVQRQQAGWFAVGKAGMSSGPWDTADQAQDAADGWNAATGTPDPAGPYVRALAGIDLPDSLAWSVRLSTRRRSLGATIEPGGAVLFTVPAGATPEAAAAAARRIRGRLLVGVADMRENGPTIVTKDLVSGEGFPFAGRPYRLRLVDADGRMPGGTPGTVHPGVPCIDEPGPSTWSGVRTWQLTLRRDRADAATVAEWYRVKGQAWLDEHMPRLCARVGIRDADLPTWSVRPYKPVKGYGGAWGTYRPRTHSIDVDWFVFQFPRDRVEYVALHEAAHAKLRGAGGHGPLWQAVVARAVPGWRELDQATRSARGVSLWLGKVSDRAPEPAPAPFVSAWADLEVTR